MVVAKKEPIRAETDREATIVEARQERWAPCYVSWTGVLVGALTAISIMLLFGLGGIALGAHLVGPENRVVDMSKVGLLTLIFSVCGAFFSAVAGGWIAARIAGILHSEPAMIHGAIVWLVTVPLLVLGAGLGAASLFGGWYAGLGLNPSASTSAPYVQPDPPGASASAEEMATYQTQQEEYSRGLQQWHDESPRATRNSALMAILALLIGLLGSVIGGWMASGEPMDFAYYRTRKPLYHLP